jgi:hypothetical protein
LLAWYRGFHPDVAEALTAEQFFTGGMILRGWPLTLESAAFSSSGGTVKVPGLAEPVRIGPMSGGRARSKLVLGPVRLALGSEIADAAAPKGKRLASTIENTAELTISHDLNTQAGSISIEGNILRAEDFLRLTAALGRPLNHGWELTGQASAAMRWEWDKTFQGRWNGRIGFSKVSLTVAGLNQPLIVNEGALHWVNGSRVARLTRVDGFGGTWTGLIERASLTDEQDVPEWHFQLHGDHLDASELDRWVGPRARPNWLQRLLPSLLGTAAPSAPASELVRRVQAQGELDVQTLVIEKLKLERVHAIGMLQNLQLSISEADAEWAGGKVRAKIEAKFLPRPAYRITAGLDRVSLAQLPGAGKVAERIAGLASGTLELRTEGVGREELLRKLTGHGDVHLTKAEFRGWDVNASVADGVAHTGISRWRTGEGTFLLKDRGIQLQELRLDGGSELTLVSGTLSFGRDAELTVETTSPQKGKNRKVADLAAGHILKISGPLDGPKVSVEKAGARQPAD